MIMKNFFNQKWVEITAMIFVAVGSLVLILGGIAVGEIAKIPALVAGIVSAVGALILFFKSLINKKETTEEEKK